MNYLGYSIMQPDILARKHIAREKRISQPVSHGMIQEVALGQSHRQLQFQDCFHILNLLKLNYYYRHNTPLNFGK